MSRRAMAGAAFGWALLEAVVFFVIPDVLLTWIAAKYGARRAIVASIWAGAGAVVGGVIAYSWGALSPETAATYMAWLPGIDSSMISDVGSKVAADGPIAILSGPIRGEPYKLYAAAAGYGGVSLAATAWWTIPGRLWRFVALSGLFGLVRAGSSRATNRNVDRPLFIAWAVFWVIVYTVFWTT